MKNLKFIPVFLVLFVALVASNSFADNPTKPIDIVTWGYGAYAPCGNNGSGEMIWGDLTIRIIRIIRDEGVHETYVPLGGDVVGQDSGEIFRAVGAANNAFSFSGDGGSGSQVWINHYIGDMGTKLKVYHKIHFTLNAHGETTAVFDHSVVDCK